MNNPRTLLVVLAVSCYGCSPNKDIDYFVNHPSEVASTIEQCRLQPQTDPRICEAAQSAQTRIGENAYQNALATFKSKDWLEQEQILKDRRCDASDYPGTDLTECKAFRVAYRQKVEEFDAKYQGKDPKELEILRENFCKAEAERYKEQHPYFSDCNLMGRLIQRGTQSEHAALSGTARETDKD